MEGAATFAKRYSILEELGAGGFAKVYRARQLSTAQEVAVKVLQLERRSGTLTVDHQLDRFRRETRLCAELHHPNVVSLVDSGETEDGALFVVFALVPGKTLASILREEGALEPAEALHLMSQVLDAISCAHLRGIVHRDLKPENIMVSSTGARRNAMVLDFGIGTVSVESQLHDLERLTQTGEYLGTPAYSAPEQLRGAGPQLASDLYSWGLIFLECLTGKCAFGDVSSHELLHRQLSSDPIPIPDALLGSVLGDVLLLVTEKDVQRRNVSAVTLLSTLQRIERSHLPGKRTIQPPAWDGHSSPGAGKSQRSPARELHTDRWLVPLGRNPNFVGRKALLSAIAQLLDSARLAVVALHGLGGVGKSQVALEFAYLHAERYQLVAWLRSEAPETLAADYSAMAGPLGLPATPDQHQTTQAVRHWLERHTGWLLIFDNAPHPSALRQYLPRTHGGHIVVTSRHHSWRNLAASVPVPVLEPEESVSFLTHRTGDRNEGGARQLSVDLGHLPLALEEAAAYIEATGRTISSYLTLFHSHRQRALMDNGNRANGTMRMTWELSFRAVEQEGPVAAELLKLCSFLAPDDLPYLMLRPRAGRPLPRLGDRLGDEVALDACISTLRRYSLVHTEQDSFSLHRLVQLATRERLSEAERSEYALWALELVELAYPTNSIAGDASPESSRLLPHAMAALSHLDDPGRCPQLAARVLRRTGIYLSARGRHLAARDHLERALALFGSISGGGVSGGSVSGADATEVGGVLWELGLVHYALGEAEEARIKLERGLALLRTEPTPSAQLLCAQTLISLAWVFRTLGKFEQSLAVSGACNSLARAKAGSRHSVVPMSLALMARAEWSLNRLEAAREHVREALAALEEVENALPLVCGTWYTLAQLSYDFGDFDRAFDCAEKGRLIGEPAYGRDHALVALNYYIQGLVLARRGETNKACELLLQAAESGERICLFVPEDLALARVEWIHRQSATDGPARTVEILSQALSERTKVCESRARFEAVCRTRLAAQLCALGRLQDARSECAAALEVIGDCYGHEHPLCIPALNQLGRVYCALGERQSALDAFSRGRCIGEAACASGHPDLLEATSGLDAAHRLPGSDLSGVDLSGGGAERH